MQEDYISKFQSNIELRIANLLNQMKQNHIRQHQLQQQQQMQQQNHQQSMAHHNLQSNSSAAGLMIPTPGISHNLTGNMRMSSAVESNQGINPTSGPAGMNLNYRYPFNLPLISC
jgi:TolA-binding protein